MNFKISFSAASISFINIDKSDLSYFLQAFYKLKKSYNPPLVVEITYIPSFKIKEHTFLELDSYCDGKNFFFLDSKGKKILLNFNEFNSKEIKLKVEKGFDSSWLFNLIIEPLIIIYSLKNNYLFLHSSAIAKDNKCDIFAAWQHTGKTRIILESMKKGFSFIGDDFSIIQDQSVFVYPKNINIFSYNLKDFLSKHKAIKIRTALRLRMTSLIRKALYLLSRSSFGSISKVLFRISELAEASTNTKLSPYNLGLDVLEDAKLHRVILLQKTTGPQIIKEIKTEEACQKISIIMKYELREFFSIYAKYQYFFPDRKIDEIDNFINYYLKILENNIHFFRSFLIPDDNIQLEKIIK